MAGQTLESLLRLVGRATPIHFGAVIFGLALTLRVLLSVFLWPDPGGLYGENWMVAKNLARTGEFANPYALPTGPSAHPSPLPVFAGAAVLRMFPERTAAHVIRAISIFAAALLWALLPWASERLRFGAVPGATAGAYGATVPLLHFVEVHAWEPVVTGLGLLVLTVWGVVRRPAWRPDAATFAFGAAWGALTLWQPICFLTFLALAGLHVITSPARRQPSRAAGAALLGCLLMLAPWTVRNYAEFGKFIFVRGNLGLELAVSNHDGAKVTMHENLFGNPETLHPNHNRNAVEQLALEGEASYYARQMQIARHWIATHPTQFASLTMRRIAAFWTPPRVSPAVWTLQTFGIVLGFCGIALLWRRHRPAAVIILAMWLSYPWVHYLVQTELRYSYPVMWTIYLGIGYIVTAGGQALWGRFGRG